MPSILITGCLFVVWDIWFTRMGIWGFNPSYVTGHYFVNLPMEEILFFICVPFACIFTYEAARILSVRERVPQKIQKHITEGLAVTLLLAGIWNYDKWYTSSAFILAGLYLACLRWIWKANYLGNFYWAFLFILLPFFIVNGILTGTGIDQPVVWYNDAENLGIRIGTIPVEDVFYGLLLILMNVSIFEYLQRPRRMIKP